LHHEVQKFSSGTCSPGWSRKKGHKTVVVVVVMYVKCGVVCWFDCQVESKEEPVSLLVETAGVRQFEESGERQTKPGIVSWSPPLPNWNPWTSCNIDEGPLSVVMTMHFKMTVVVDILFCQLTYAKNVQEAQL